MEFHFGGFKLDTDQGRLTGPNGQVVLRRQSWRLLVELLEQAPALVERDDLLDRVWGRTALSPNALPQTISELRQALGDSARNARYIETCHGRGYRMVCAVERHRDERAPTIRVAAEAASAPTRPAHSLPWQKVAGATALAILAVIFGWQLTGERSSEAERVTDGQPMVETLQRQAEVALRRHDPAAAAAHLRALALLEPARTEWALAQAEAELDALQGEQARRTLAFLAADPAFRLHPRLLILQARLAEVDGDFEQAVALADSARMQARSLAQSGLIGQAVMTQARAWQRQGDLASAAEVLAEALEDQDVEFSDAERFDLNVLLAVFRRDQGQLEQARIVFEQAGRLQTHEHERQRLIIENALLLSAVGQHQSAWQELMTVQTDPRPPLPPTVELAYHSALGLVSVELGDIDRGLEAYERGFALARSTGRAYQVAGLQINAGSLMARHDRFDEAERLWNDALETFERIGDRRGQAITQGNLAAAASAQGHNTRSQSLNRQALKLFRELGLVGPMARTAFNLALVASREGRLDDAEALLAESQQGYEQAGNVELLLHVGAFRVDHRVLAGDLILAETLLHELENEIEKGSPLRQAGVHASRGRLSVWRGDLDAARRAFDQALELRRQSGQEAWVATSELELLQLDLLAGVDPWSVRVRAGELAELFTHRDQLRAAGRARLLAAEALLSQGDVAQAQSELQGIRSEQDRFSDLGLLLDLAWVEAWAVREEERLPRLEALARRALQYGYFGKLSQIEAGLAARGLALEDVIGIEDGFAGSGSAVLVALLPPYASASED